MKARLFILALLAAIGVTAGAQTQATAYDTNRGFVHPGGLHTQADFDRIKAQLAAGNPTVKAAYQKLTSAAYAQANVQTYPTETIVRGGGSGENYMNACRGAAMAYQNALRWKIAGTKANAEAAVRVLMAWAGTTKAIGGDSNYALASGLYGYEFAQAAELMRDYEGWSREDFDTFKRWMLDLWYPYAIGFLRGRNGTWENAGKWWQAPGHYWSNWGLCNAMCVALIGVLCDDVFIYNQGMSYFKYDQCNTFTDPRTAVPILNDGLAEFLGNLVVTTYPFEKETGAYGLVGQMNESGRDTGHSAMALGLAVDMAKVGWNQGDDLFAYMNHRLAAGIEYVAAQTQSVTDLPWVNYHRAESGYFYTDGRSWLMTAPAMGAQMRPYWGTVIGIYEGVKGVRMPFAEVSYTNMGIDEGGLGGTSGGYDHLGYSVLMNTRDEQLCPPEKVPTELTPLMEYSGTINANLIPSLDQERKRGLVSGRRIAHNELGGLVNTYTVNNNTTLPTGRTVVLMPQLPEGEEDTGLWRWDTGETTRDITVTTDRSHIYRVTYTNARGVQSQLAFALAVTGDCTTTPLTPEVTVGGESVRLNAATQTYDVLYGKAVVMKVTPATGWGTYKWTGGSTQQSLSKSVTADAQYTAEYKNQGGAVTQHTFNIRMVPAMPYVTLSSKTVQDSTAVVAAGSTVTLGLTLPSTVKGASVTWSDGSTGAELTVEDVQTSGTYTATFELRGQTYTIRFNVLVTPTEASVLEPGTYQVRHIGTDTYLTAQDKSKAATFEPLDAYNIAQYWRLERNNTPKYNLISLATADSLRLNSSGKMAASSYFPLFIDQAVGSDGFIAIHTSSSTPPRFWTVSDGLIEVTTATTLTSFPFQLVPADISVGIGRIYSQEPQSASGQAPQVFDLSGRRTKTPRHGVYVTAGRKVLVR